MEFRYEALVARRATYAFDIGVAHPLSNYARAAIWAGGGGPLEDFPNGTEAPDYILRAEGAVRFLLDPFAERAKGFYAGAGMGIRWDPHSSGKEYLFLLFGVEGRPMSKPVWRMRLLPAVELGLGDGARLAFVIRQARQGYR